MTYRHSPTRTQSNIRYHKVRLDETGRENPEEIETCEEHGNRLPCEDCESNYEDGGDSPNPSDRMRDEQIEAMRFKR